MRVEHCLATRHDLHVAALVGAAHILSARREELAGDVVLMFQPGEEGPGGAEPMVAEGLLDVAGRRVQATLTSLRSPQWDSMAVNFFVLTSPSSVPI